MTPYTFRKYLAQRAFASYNLKTWTLAPALRSRPQHIRQGLGLARVEISCAMKETRDILILFIEVSYCDKDLHQEAVELCEQSQRHAAALGVLGVRINCGFFRDEMYWLVDRNAHSVYHCRTYILIRSIVIGRPGLKFLPSAIALLVKMLVKNGLIVEVVPLAVRRLLPV